MDSRHSWIDRRELSELLKQLLPDPDPASGLSGKTGPGTDAEDPISLLADDAPEWEDIPTPPPARRTEAELRQEALRSLHSILPFTTGSFSPGDGTVPPPQQPQQPPSIPVAPRSHPQSPAPASPPAPTGPGFHMPFGPLTVRLRAFATWVGLVTGCSQLFITDAQGYSLLDSDSPEDAAAIGSALQLLDALDKFRQRMSCPNARSGLYLPLAPNQWFGVVECESSLGTVCLCLIIPAPLSAAAALELARVLQATIEA